MSDDSRYDEAIGVAFDALADAKAATAEIDANSIAEDATADYHLRRADVAIRLANTIGRPRTIRAPL